METFLFSEHVFGPVKSRRLGSSLGINLLSTKQKVCNFNCIYCECGLTEKLRANDVLFVNPKELLEKLELKLIHCKENNIPIDTITYAGNGEPTMHPSFLSIARKVSELRARFFPDAKTALLSNGTTLGRKNIESALKYFDLAIIKLDAGDDRLLRLIDLPKDKQHFRKLLNNLERLRNKLIIQTMFLKGNVNGEIIDNSSEKAVSDWIKKLKEIKPLEVQLYSIDRSVPVQGIERIPKDKLDKIALKVEETGIKTRVV